MAITSGIRNKSIIKQKENTHDKIVLLAKTKLRTIEVLISMIIVESNISYDEFVLVNNVIEKYGAMKETIKNLKTLTNVFLKS